MRLEWYEGKIKLIVKRSLLISYLKTSQAFKQPNPLKNSLGSYFQSVSGSVGITLLVFPLSVGLTSSHLLLLGFILNS